MANLGRSSIIGRILQFGTGVLQWNPTTTRTITLPDKSGTVLLQGDAADLDGVISRNDLTVDCNGSSLTTPRTLGLFNFFNGAARFQFGDAANCLQCRFGGRIQLLGWHGIECYGASQLGSLPFASGNGAFDYNFSIIGSVANTNLLRIQGTGDATGNALESWRGSTQMSRIDARGNIFANSYSAQSGFTVAALPATTGYQASSQIWCSNGRKTGEAAGAGTGVWVVPVGSTWCLLNTTTVVTA